MAANSKTKPTNLGHANACRLLSATATIAIFWYYSAGKMIFISPSHREQKVQWRRQRSKGARSFRGQKILQPDHPDALFLLKTSWRPFFLCNIFIFCSHTITEAKQPAGRPEPGRWIFQPGHLTWCTWCSADLDTAVSVCSPWPRLHITVVFMTNAQTAHSKISYSDLMHCSQAYYH